MKPSLSSLAACGVGLMVWLDIVGVAAAQPSALPPPPIANAPAASGAAAGDDLIRGDFSLKQREDRLAALLESSVADGSLSGAESTRARGELAAIQAREDSIRRRHHGELTDTTTFRLEGRIKALIASLRWNP